MRYDIINIQDHPERVGAAAEWFHPKWGKSRQAYEESMRACVEGRAAVPQWYIALDEDRIVGGLGLIGNDFHERKDLAPNVCAVYVEEAYRYRGIAGELLGHVCAESKKRGIGTLYLLTDHTAFYERYGWEFYCMARCGGEDNLSRIYVHRV